MQNKNGSKLRQVRQARGWSIDDVSVLAGVDPATVWRVEEFRVKPKPETVVALARAYRMSPRRLARMVKQ